MLDSILTFLNSSIVGLTVSDVFIISLFVLSLVLTVVSSVVILTAKVKKIDLEVEKTKNNQAVTEKIIQNRLDSILDKLNSEVFLEKTSCIAKDIDVDILKNNYIKQNINISDDETAQNQVNAITAPSKSNLNEEVINQAFEKAENIPLVQENIAVPYKEEEKVVVTQNTVTTTTVNPEENQSAISNIYASVPKIDNVNANNGELSALINKYAPSNNTYGVSEHDSSSINHENDLNHTLVDYNLPENQNLYSNTFDYRDYLPKNTEKPNDYTAIINKYSHSNKNQINKFNFSSSNSASTDFSKYSAKNTSDFGNYKPYVPYTPAVPATNKLAYTPSKATNDFSSSTKHITFENKFSNKNYSDVFSNEKNKPATSVFKPFSRSNNLEASFTPHKEKPAIPFMQSKKNAPKNNFLERSHNADRDTNSGFKIAPISSKKNNVVISSKPHTIHPVAAEIIPAQKTHLKKTSLITKPMPSQIHDEGSFYGKNSFKNSGSSIKINDFKYPIN